MAGNPSPEEAYRAVYREFRRKVEPWCEDVTATMLDRALATIIKLRGQLAGICICTRCFGSGNIVNDVGEFAFHEACPECKARGFIIPDV